MKMRHRSLALISLLYLHSCCAVPFGGPPRHRGPPGFGRFSLFGKSPSSNSPHRTNTGNEEFWSDGKFIDSLTDILTANEGTASSSKSQSPQQEPNAAPSEMHYGRIPAPSSPQRVRYPSSVFPQELFSSSGGGSGGRSNAHKGKGWNEYAYPQSQQVSSANYQKPQIEVQHIQIPSSSVQQSQSVYLGNFISGGGYPMASQSPQSSAPMVWASQSSPSVQLQQHQSSNNYPQYQQVIHPQSFVHTPQTSVSLPQSNFQFNSQSFALRPSPTTTKSTSSQIVSPGSMAFSSQLKDLAAYQQSIAPSTNHLQITSVEVTKKRRRPHQKPYKKQQKRKRVKTTTPVTTTTTTSSTTPVPAPTSVETTPNDEQFNDGDDGYQYDGDDSYDDDYYDDEEENGTEPPQPQAQTGVSPFKNSPPPQNQIAAPEKKKPFTSYLQSNSNVGGLYVPSQHIIGSSTPQQIQMMSRVPIQTQQNNIPMQIQNPNGPQTWHFPKFQNIPVFQPQPQAPRSMVFDPQGQFSQPQQIQIQLPTPTPTRQILIATVPPTTAPAQSPLTDSEIENGLEKPNLVGRLSDLVETGRKILYFPRGVVDVVDHAIGYANQNPYVGLVMDTVADKLFGSSKLPNGQKIPFTPVGQLPSASEIIAAISQPPPQQQIQTTQQTIKPQ